MRTALTATLALVSALALAAPAHAANPCAIYQDVFDGSGGTPNLSLYQPDLNVTAVVGPGAGVGTSISWNFNTASQGQIVAGTVYNAREGLISLLGAYRRNDLGAGLHPRIGYDQLVAMGYAMAQAGTDLAASPNVGGAFTEDLYLSVWAPNPYASGTRDWYLAHAFRVRWEDMQHRFATVHSPGPIVGDTQCHSKICDTAVYSNAEVQAMFQIAQQSPTCNGVAE